MRKLFSKNLVAILAPIFLIVLFFLPNILAGKIPIPADSLLGLYHPFRDESFQGFNPGKFPIKNPLTADPILQTYPWKYQTIENLKNLILPFWNPYNFSGQPLLANSQSAPFSILNILFFIFSFNTAWTLYIILPTLLTGLFMYLFLKSLNLSKPASVFGAFVLPFTGFFVSWMTWGTVVTTAMWLPLILLCTNRLFEKLSPIFFLILVFSLSQAILSGHLQTALYVFLATSLFTIYKFFSTKFLRPFMIIICSLILSLIVSAFQILPTLEFINLSNRDIDQSYQKERRDWFLPPQNLVQLIAPDYFGNPTTYNYWGIWNYGEFVSYMGILPLFLVALALFKHDKKILFFTILAAVSLVLSLSNPISKLPYVANLAFISTMQPSRIIFLLNFSLVVLAAFGLDLFLRERFRKNYLILLLAFIFTIITVLAVTQTQKGLLPEIEGLNPAKIASRNLVLPLMLSISIIGIFVIKTYKNVRYLLISAVFLITLIDLFRFAAKFTSFTKSSLIFPQTKTTQFLESQEKPFRIMAADRRVLHPNSNAVYKIESVNGYDPLFLKDYATLVSSWNANTVSEAGSFNRIVTPQIYESQLVNFLNIKYLLSLNEVSDPRFVKVYEEGETKVYENKNVLPRAFFTNEVVKVASYDEALQYLLSPNFDPRESFASSEFSHPKQINNTSTSFDNYSDQNFALSVFTEKESPLIVSNAFYPGWQAFIDGNKTNIYKANFMFQSIIIPQGNHKIEFKFQSQSFYNGLYVSTVGLIATILTAIIIWRKKSL